ncbi:hypothetical protein [Xanthobacter sp. 91]|uniref:hypothetical protein n=1 Tax=Xanthobacter sp. 91 TaxID=1117244 RepID=UPI000496486A|nr:hypothetical protein [Xanthobacter sp. 91]
MTPHPDQLTPQEAAAAFAAVSPAVHVIEDIQGALDRLRNAAIVLPRIVGEATLSGDETELTTRQQEAATDAATVLALAHTLHRRLGTAIPALHAALNEAQQAEGCDVFDAFFGKAA